MILLAHAILDLIGIPVYALLDADGGFEARALKNRKGQDEIEKEKVSNAAANRKVLKYFGRTEEDFPSAVVADNVAIFGDHIESFLSENWPEWETACKNIAAATGVNLNKNQLAYRAATLKAEGIVPEMLMRILVKAEGK
jgi:hypothetical protein